MRLSPKVTVSLLGAFLLGCPGPAPLPGGFPGGGLVRPPGPVRPVDAGDVAVPDGSDALSLAIEGRVLEVLDLYRGPDPLVGRSRGVAGATPAGDFVEIISAADGAFRLTGLAILDPSILAVSGDPPSWAHVETRGMDVTRAILPVVNRATLSEAVGSAGRGLTNGLGVVVAWWDDDAGAPVAGVQVRLEPNAAPEGPLYDSFAGNTLVPFDGTGPGGLAVVLDVPAGTYRLVGLPADPTLGTATARVEVTGDVASFVRVRVPRL